MDALKAKLEPLAKITCTDDGYTLVSVTKRDLTDLLKRSEWSAFVMGLFLGAAAAVVLIASATDVLQAMHR
jgi:hypothetical protein